MCSRYSVSFPDVFSMYCAILLRCFLQVLRFLLRRFLHVMCFPAQMFSPCTVLFCSDDFSRYSVSCSDVFFMYCAFLLRCFLHVLCFPAQMCSPCTVLFCSDVFSRYPVSCSDVFSRNSDSSTIKTHHSDINTSNPNTYYVLQSILVTSVALSFVLIVTNM